MFETLSGHLEEIFSRLRGRGRLRPEDVDEALGEIRRALLAADVATPVVTAFRERVRERALAAELHRALNPAQQVVRIVHEELVRTLGGEAMSVTFASVPPTVVLLAGLQGSGKTTTAAKLARWFRSRGRSPLLVGADLTRPAATEQLRVLAAEIGVPVFSEAGDPVSVAAAGLAEARRLGRDVVVCDTAGRQVIDDDLMAEISGVAAAIEPHYTFLVLDAMTGQEAARVGQTFGDALGLDAVILTKLDGDARGGAALSVSEVVGCPVAFVSTGERIGDFEPFHPDRLAGRILGMGDMLSLAEKAEEAYEGAEAAEAADAAERVLAGDFTLDDFLSQMRQLRKLGGLGDVLSHLPSAQAAQAADAGVDDRRLGRMEAVICSMTPAERAQPAIIDGSRRRRIAAGSGTSPGDVAELLRNFAAARKLMRSQAAGAPRRSKGGKGRKGKGRGSRVTPAGAGRSTPASGLVRQLEQLESSAHPSEESDAKSAPGQAAPLAWPGR